MASTFPNQIDIIETFLDMTQEDYVSLNQFQDYLKKGDFANANKILNEISDSSRKIVSAERLNKLRDCILKIEKFYKEEIKPYINTKQEEWENIIYQFNYKGVYNSSIQYYKQNFVLLKKDGLNQLFICIEKPPIGTSPLIEKYWRVFTVRGERGKTFDEKTTFSFEWVSDYNYEKNIIVYYEKNWWISIQKNLDKTPQFGSEYWELILEIKQPIYPVQPNQPNTQNEGEIWFQTF